MKVFKFGGASVKDAPAIRTMAGILQKYAAEKILIVVSAMGKTTNALELLVSANPTVPGEWITHFEDIRKYHLDVARELGIDLDTEIHTIFDELKAVAQSELSGGQRYASIVSFGEILSTRIVTEFLIAQGMDIDWLDARQLVLTDSDFMEGTVDWEETGRRIRSTYETIPSGRALTQGFIAADTNGKTTVLGREGSDFTAAIFATSLGADSVTVWKDVAGIMNGDPKKFTDTRRYEELPYREAAEMTYYGASVIHPKTIKPLANRSIPLYVRSFFHPEEPGTVIHDCSLEGIMPSISVKHNQCLVSFQVKDYTFINEHNLSKILHEISLIHMKINLMQTSATSLSVCSDFNKEKLTVLMEKLQQDFSIRYNTGLDLVTIKHYTDDFLDLHLQDKHVLLEQMTRQNYQALIQPA
jgi:aspartate kinase